MPDLQPTPTHAAQPVSLADPARAWPGDDADYAFGCECADPALQIERWHESLGEGGEPH